MKDKIGARWQLSGDGRYSRTNTEREESDSIEKY